MRGSGQEVRGGWVRNGRGRAGGIPRDTLHHTTLTKSPEHTRTFCAVRKSLVALALLLRERASRGLNAESPPCPNSPGLTNRPANPSPLPLGSSFVFCPPTQRSIIPNILPLYIVRAPRTPCLPAPPAWAPLGNKPPSFSTKYPPYQGSALPVQQIFCGRERKKAVCQGSTLPVRGENRRKTERRTAVWTLSR